MCRFVAYRGDPIPISDLIFRPPNSLVHQALDAMESPTRINADGFGVGWYNLGMHPEPAVFKDVAPAWNNRNLRSVADKVSSDCILAHVRAARRYDPIGRANCHPFHYRSLLWMHNGDVPGRGRLHRRVAAKCGDGLVALMGGNTDSELVFLLFLSYLAPPLSRPFSADELARALQQTIEQVAGWWREDEETRLLALNLCLTDGRVMVASRFACGGDSPSLYYCVGSRYVCQDGSCRIETDGSGSACAVIASEKLSQDPHWKVVEPDGLVVVHGDLRVERREVAQPQV